MATKLWDDFFPWVMLDVRDCPPAIARDAIRNSAIEFCERAEAWRVDLDPVMTAPNVPDYDLDKPANSVVWRIRRVVHNGLPIDASTPEDLDITHPGWQAQKGDPFCYFTKNLRRTLSLVYTPASTKAVLINAALKPAAGATAIDSVFFEEFFREVSYGAKALLMEMKDKAWTSAAKAAENRGHFDKAIASFNVEGSRHGTTAPLRTRTVHSLQ